MLLLAVFQVKKKPSAKQDINGIRCTLYIFEKTNYLNAHYTYKNQYILVSYKDSKLIVFTLYTVLDTFYKFSSRKCKNSCERSL